jgi:hypothetical protein
MEMTQVLEWFSKFRNGVTFLEDVECLGCPLTSRTEQYVDHVRDLVLRSKRIAVLRF